MLKDMTLINKTSILRGLSENILVTAECENFAKTRAQDCSP